MTADVLADDIASNDFYLMRDMSGSEVCLIGFADAQALVKKGYAQVITNRSGKRRIKAIQLTVSLAKANDQDGPARSYVPANYAGARFVFRSKFSTASANFYEYRHKKMTPADSPEHALLRILTPPAIEGTEHRLRHKCSLEEQESDPGRERRRNVAAIFHI